MTRKTWLGLWAIGALMTLGACANGEETNQPFMRDPDVVETTNGEFETCVSPVVGCPCKQGLCVEGLVCEAQMCREPIPPATDGDPTFPPTVTDTDGSDSSMTLGDTDTDSGSVSDSDTDAQTETTSDTDTDTDSSTTDDPTDPTDPTEGTAATGDPADPCQNATAGSGHYCGNSLNGIDNALYHCSAGGNTIEVIDAGACDCVVCPPGFADYCDGGFEPAASCAPEPPTCGNGICGDDESCASCPSDCGQPSCTDAYDEPVCAGDPGVIECMQGGDGVQPCTCNADGSWTSCSAFCLS